MRRLFPVTYETADHAAHEPREWSLDELADAYAYPSGQDVWLRANMVSTLDGAAHHDGRSQGISCAADMRIFGTLRGLADAVLVGAETVRLEGYRPARAREAFAARRQAAGQGPAPAIAVITASLNLDFSLPLFTSPLVPTFVVTGAGAPSDRVEAARKAGCRGADRRMRAPRSSRSARSGRSRSAGSPGCSRRADPACSVSSWQRRCSTNSV